MPKHGEHANGNRDFQRAPIPTAVSELQPRSSTPPALRSVFKVPAWIPSALFGGRFPGTHPESQTRAAARKVWFTSIRDVWNLLEMQILWPHLLSHERWERDPGSASERASR